MKLARLMSVTALACVSALSAACSVGGDDEMLSPRAEVIDQTSAAMTSSGLWYVNGQYWNCRGHADASIWSLALGPTSERSNVLKIARGDTGCQLRITAIEKTDEGEPPVISLFTTKGAPLSLSDAFNQSPTPFANGGDPNEELAFFGNARLSTATYDAPFWLTLVLSDSSAEETTKSASFTSYQVSADPHTAAHPNYQSSMDGFHIGVDYADVVVDLDGSFDLVAPEYLARPGDGYVVSKGPFSSPPTFAEIHAEYTDSLDEDMSVVARESIPENQSTVSLDAANFGLMGQDLTHGVDRWIIIHREEAAVPSYQIIRVTFEAPTSF